MTTFPRSPILLKGAIIAIDPTRPLPNVIIFQYNPDTLTRTLAAQTTGSDNAARGEVLRFTAPPQENIRLEIEIDATDQLEQAQPLATTLGIYPALAALEMLLYPKSSLMIANEVLARTGVIEVIPPEAPLTLFAWGVQRILPVRLTEFTITEQAFDANLNPIRAEVSLSLRVLNYQDLGLASVGGSLFMAHQIAQEVIAQTNIANNAASAASFVGSFNLGG